MTGCERPSTVRLLAAFPGDRLANRFLPGEHQLADLQPRRSEIDQQGMLPPRRPQIAEDLGEMFGHEALHRLDLDDEHILDEDIREILSERRPIPVADPQRILGDGGGSLPLQPVQKAVLLDFFEVAVAEVPMQVERSRAHLIAEFKDGVGRRFHHGG